MAVFDNVRMPVDYEIGAQGGPQFATTILDLSGGGEARNQDWSECRASWTISYGIDDIENYRQLIAFFYARRGRFRAFRFKDWVDYNAVAAIPTGLVDGTNAAYQLALTYDDGSGVLYTRRITRPVDGTLVVRDNGVVKTIVTDYTVDYSTGIITFVTPPLSGHVIDCDFEFDIPVRFDTDQFQRVAETQFAVSYSSIKIREIIE